MCFNRLDFQFIQGHCTFCWANFYNKENIWCSNRLSHVSMETIILKFKQFGEKAKDCILVEEQNGQNTLFCSNAYLNILSPLYIEMDVNMIKILSQLKLVKYSLRCYNSESDFISLMCKISNLMELWVHQT